MSYSPGNIDFSYINLLARDTISSFAKLVSNVIKISSDGLSISQTKQTTLGLVLILSGGLIYSTRKLTYWSRRNVKTPTPIPLFGNVLSFLLSPRQKLEVEWPRKYGKVYGIYMGTKPHLVIADARVLQRICTKDFDKFTNHHFFSVKNKYQKHFLIMQEDDHWRGMRAIISPTFTGSKIKVIYRVLEGCTDELVSSFRDLVNGDQNQGPIIKCKQYFSPFTMGSALSSFYGIEPKKKLATSDNDTEDDSRSREGFARRSRKVFQVSFLRFSLVNFLPEKMVNYLQLSLFSAKPLEFFAENAQRIIEQRRRTDRHYNDYLQLLLEAKLEDESSKELELASDKHENHHAYGVDGTKALDNNNQSAADGWRPSKMRLTDMEVSCQTMMLMVVATETTATLLSNVVYLLANNTKVQQKLHEELMKIAQRDDQAASYKFDYEQLTSCLYLDCVISETLRFLGSIIFVDRVAKEDYYIEEYDVWVQKGTVVNLALFAIQRDPDYWPEPEKFDPDRFKSENKLKIVPGSYCPFGVGPRHCVGFRFALTEAKLALAKLMTEFRFDKAPNCDYPPKPKGISFIMSDNLDHYVKLCCRH